MSEVFDHVARVARLVDVHGAGRDALLPMLHDLQSERGWIDEQTIRALASALNLSRAEIHGVVSFYHDFRTEPAGRPVIKLCRAEACQARGVEQLAEQFRNERVKLETVYCLGLCSVGPNALVGTQVHARLNAEKLAKLAEGVQ